MSRNSEKFQKQKTEKTEPEKTTSQTIEEILNKLSFANPKVTVDLPTKGKFYPSSSPLSGVASIEIKHMTAKEEDLLTSVSVSNTSDIYGKLIDSLLVSPLYKSHMFCEEDKTAILINARISGYGSEYVVSDYCYNCKQAVHMKYDLEKSEIIDPELKEVEYIPELDEYRVTLPKTGIPVGIKNFTSEDEVSLLKEKEKKDSLGIEFNYTIAYINRIITSIAGEQDHKLIAQLSNVMPAADAKFLHTIYEKIRPKLSTAQEVTCPSCQVVSRKEVPVSWAFFRINS